MKIKKIRIMIIIVSFLIIIMNDLLANKNDAVFEKSFRIAEPIIDIQKDELINTQILENSFPIEYNFYINNFLKNKINEVDFEYFIEINNSNEKFPVNYKLIDCDKNEEILLTNGKSEEFMLAKDIQESRHFKIILIWQELDCELAKDLKINLKIKGVQSKGVENE